MKQRRFGKFYGVRYSDLNAIGDYAREALERLAALYGSGRIYGLGVTPAGNQLQVAPGYALFALNDRTVLASLGSAQTINLSGYSSGYLKLIAAWTDQAGDTLLVSPPPQTLPNGQPNPFYNPNLAGQSYNLDRLIAPTINLRMESDLYEAANGEFVLARVYWNGSSASVVSQADYPPSRVGDRTIAAIKLADDVAGAGLVRDGVGGLVVNVDNSSLEVVNDTVRVKAGGITDAHLGNRTIAQATAPADSGSLAALLSGLANRIKAITGKSDWKTDPRTTLEMVTVRDWNETINGSWTFSASPSVPTPTAAAHAVRKDYVDSLVSSSTGSVNSGLSAHKTAAVLDHPDGSVTTPKLGDGSVTAPKLAPGAAVANLGYTPLNKAGDTMSGRLNINGERLLHVFVDQGNDTTTRYYYLGRIWHNNGMLKAQGILGGHIDGRANIDLQFSARNGFQANGYIMGTVSSEADIIVLDGGDSWYYVYLVTNQWALVNLELSKTPLVGLTYNGTYQTTMPGGTLVYQLSTDFTSNTHPYTLKLKNSGELHVQGLVSKGDDPNSWGAALLRFRSASNNAMQWAIGHLGAKTGGNVGNNFAIWRYDDNGNNIGAPLTITRSTGFVGINKSNPDYRFVVEEPGYPIAVAIRKTNNTAGANAEWDGPALLVEHSYGNHSWGNVAEFRVNDATSNNDPPNITFTAGWSSIGWAVGMAGNSDHDFAIVSNRGWRFGGPGTVHLRVKSNGQVIIPGDLSVNGNILGNASSASKWQTARTLSLTGPVTGSVSMDGSADVSLATSIANASITGGMLASGAIVYDLAIFYPGTPANGALLAALVIPRNLSLTGGSVVVGTAPTDNWSATIYSGGTSIGTVSVNPGQTTGTVSLNSNPTNLTTGTLLRVVGPATANSTIRDISISFQGVV